MSTATLLNQPPANTNQPYVFISYARSNAPRDTHAAEQIEAALIDVGINCFRDKTSIPYSSRQSKEGWDLKIEDALRKCTHLTFIVSPHSMSDERDEVYREWFYFVQKRKPLLAFQLEDCELHSRFLSRNIIDARLDLPGAIQQLLAALQVKAPEYPTEDVLTQYYCDRIAEWSTPRYALDKRFVNLTLSFDQGEDEQQRWKEFQPPENRRFDDLRGVIAAAQNETKDARALVLLGNPGSGKSTLLRRLQLDCGKDRLRDGATEISFFVPLNEYKGEQKPYDWLMAEWQQRYPNLPRLENYLPKGQVLFLLDALNEMQIPASAYRKLIGHWKEFIQDVTRLNNHIIFSCRSLDYSTPLSSKELPVPHISVQPMTRSQVNDFLNAYVPELAPRIWNELKDLPQLELFQTPYFLKLLVEQAEAAGELPKGRAGLFTGFVRKALLREVEAESEIFQPGALLTERDCRRLTLNNQWESPFDLPERGALIPNLSGLAFSMQKNEMKDGAAQVALAYDEACERIVHKPAEEIIKAGTSLNILDEAAKLKFFHQSLQEYFAARRLTKEADPALVHVEWAKDKANPALEKTLSGLAQGDPLPPLPQTGWEETTLTAAPMAKAPESFLRALMEHNLPLAARCAASPEVSINDDCKGEIQARLIDRTQDMNADLRARIAAGEALGLLGDPRFKLSQDGDYLLPPMVNISGGEYPIGDDNSAYGFEKPAHKVKLPPFQIGQFPVTNAEYRYFLAAGGYENEEWWDTTAALQWLREGGNEGGKQQWRGNRETLQTNWTEDEIRAQANWTDEQKEVYLEIRNESPEDFERRMDEWFPAGKIYRQPEFWEDIRFNNPAQPVVGVTWFEARAYCNWLSARAGLRFRLPTETEFEAAARGQQGRMFPYGKTFDVSRCNTFESHIRRTTPVGIFDNATPEGAFDLSGNAYTWTLSIYDQTQFSYPYRRDDGRENPEAEGRRVLRGGSWDVNLDSARAFYRNYDLPSGRYDNIGFRVVVVPLL